MKRVIALIFLILLTSCGGSSSDGSNGDQQDANTTEQEVTMVIDEGCDSLESFDQCPDALSKELLDIQTELLGEVDPESVPYLQRKYLLNCVATSDTNVDRSEVASTCRCLYQGLVDHLRSQGTETQAVRWFIELEETISERKVPPAWAMDVYISCA